MNTMDMLRTYRTTVLEIETLEQQLVLAGRDGRPSGCRSAAADERMPSTNDPMAAAMQLCDGLESLIGQKRGLLAQLTPRICQLLMGITSGRVLQVIQCYYLFAQTDEQIGRRLGLSTTRINQIRNDFIHSAA